MLFIHAAWDVACDAVHSALAEPMREDCGNLVETTIEVGRSLMLEEPGALNEEIDAWLRERGARS